MNKPHDNATQYKLKKPSKKPQDKLPSSNSLNMMFFNCLAKSSQKFTILNSAYHFFAGISKKKEKKKTKEKKHKKIYIS